MLLIKKTLNLIEKTSKTQDCHRNIENIDVNCIFIIIQLGTHGNLVEVVEDQKHKFKF